MSTILSPPPMRRQIVTFVAPAEEDVVREALLRELARGGQCYCVVPRIADTEDVVHKFSKVLRIVALYSKYIRALTFEKFSLGLLGTQDSAGCACYRGQRTAGGRGRSPDALQRWICSRLELGLFCSLVGLFVGLF